MAGLSSAETLPEIDHRLRLEEEARRAAARRQVMAMVLPISITLAVVLGFGLVWNSIARRRGAPRSA